MAENSEQNGEIGANPMLWRNCDLDEEARIPFAVRLALYKTQCLDRLTVVRD